MLTLLIGWSSTAAAAWTKNLDGKIDDPGAAVMDARVAEASPTRS